MQLKLGFGVPVAGYSSPKQGLYLAELYFLRPSARDQAGILRLFRKLRCLDSVEVGEWVAIEYLFVNRQPIVTAAFFRRRNFLVISIAIATRLGRSVAR